MIRAPAICVIISLFVFFFPGETSPPAADQQSVLDPPVFHSSPVLLNSKNKISTANATSLSVAGEVRFNPWQLVTALAWAPGGDILAVAAGDSVFLLQVSVWKLLTAFRIGAFSTSLAFSQDGSWLAAGSRDGLIRAWFQPLSSPFPHEGGSPSVVLMAHKKGVNSLAFSPNSGDLASGGNDAVARFWDLESGQVLGLMIGGTFAVPSIAFSQDGTFLAVANGRMIRLRQVGTERILGSFQSGNPIFSLAFSPNGAWLAAGDTQNQVMLWKPEQAYRTGQEEYPEPVNLTGHNGSTGTYRALIWGVTFSPDSQLLASAGGDMTVKIWDVQKVALLASLTGHAKGVTDVAFNPVSNALASSGLDGRVLVWKIMEEDLIK